MISIQDKTTIRSIMHPFAQLLADELSAMRAQLRGMVGVNQYHGAPSLFRFGARELDQLSPCHICNRLRQSSVLEHSFDFEILKSDDLKRVDQATAEKVGKIRSSIGDPLVNTGQRLL